ncbi:DUF3299 domain-containing protein [Niveispirillum sp. SYP-B3756]|uniref:DUF3299 domain-containing protein n=1 Tax=Niveispirillum sp. SYP-B3756 TaxID=2662178 RepID=UPI001292B5C4|nr:DUF3299 domain-containing protein [Niveispirillum sp. SYP-B3756]MQP66500.1 DUF3299 domain-containing protein [Niveispirillum sp. SYP-B3756]
MAGCKRWAGLALGGLLMLAAAGTASAFKEVKDPNLAAKVNDANQPGAIPRATLGWDRIANVREVDKIIKQVSRPVALFGKEVAALDGKPFTVAGFFLPLDTADKSRKFLLSSLAPSCPFCPPPGPADLIQVDATDAVPATLEQIKLEGTLRLSAEDENGIYYHLENARVVPTS